MVALCYTILAFTVIVIPMLTFWILTQDLETIKDPIFTRRWGVLTEGLSTKSKINFLNPISFFMLRLVFVSICFLLRELGAI